MTSASTPSPDIELTRREIIKRLLYSSQWATARRVVGLTLLFIVARAHALDMGGASVITTLPLAGLLFLAAVGAGLHAALEPPQPQASFLGPITGAYVALRMLIPYLAFGRDPALALDFARQRELYASAWIPAICSYGVLACVLCWKISRVVGRTRRTAMIPFAFIAAVAAPAFVYDCATDLDDRLIPDASWSRVVNPNYVLAFLACLYIFLAAKTLGRQSQTAFDIENVAFAILLATCAGGVLIISGLVHQPIASVPAVVGTVLAAAGLGMALLRRHFVRRLHGDTIGVPNGT